jgi:c-di-GMP-binding flagellar brake protein YcgR
MKRRKRKRSSKAANPPTPKIPVDGEKAAGPSTALAEADRQTPPRDEFIAAVETEKPASPFTALAGADYVIDLGDEFITTVEEEKPARDSVTLAEADDHTHSRDEFIATVEEQEAAGPPAAPAGADRRTHPRYEFIAAAEVVAAESGARMETRVRDLSQQGCYVDTNNALPLGTVTGVRITKETQLFEAEARVVYSRAGKGMGLMFTAIEPEQIRTLETWLVESRETSWLAANRRRSQRVLMTIPVRVSGQNVLGSPFEEETQTLAISAHGALILVSTQVYRGQRLTLSNVQAKAALECVVAHIDRHQSDHPQVGVEFMLPNPIFWHVAFPPKDWTPRHPHAKSQAKTGESS